MEKGAKQCIGAGGILFLALFAGAVGLVGTGQAEMAPLMGDELVSVFLGQLPWGSLMEALRSGADSQGLAFHVLNKVWLAMGGSKDLEVWARVPSMAAWTVALWALWKGLGLLGNQWEGKEWLVAGTTLTLLTWPEVLLHLAENRAYGLLMASVAATYWANMSILREGQNRTNMIGIAVAQGAGILSHPMAGVFGMGSLLALQICAYGKKEGVWKAGLAYLAGWLALLPWIGWGGLGGQVGGTLTAQVDWAGPPSGAMLIDFLQPSWWLLAVAALWALAGRRHATKDQGASLAMATGVIFVGVGIILWVVSQVTNPLFLERYVLPVCLGWTTLAAGAGWEAGRRSRSRDWDWKHLRWLDGASWESGLAILLGIVALGWAYKAPLEPRSITGGFWSENPWVDTGLADLRHYKEGIPVICETSTIYLPRHHYFGEEKEYWLLLDKAAAEADGGPAGMDYAMNKALKGAAGDEQGPPPKQRILLQEEGIPWKQAYVLDEDTSSSAQRAFPQERYRWTEIRMSEEKEPERGDGSHRIRLFKVERLQEEP
jgi:hypothetical protein